MKIVNSASDFAFGMSIDFKTLEGIYYRMYLSWSCLASCLASVVRPLGVPEQLSRMGLPRGRGEGQGQEGVWLPWDRRCSDTTEELERTWAEREE
jgi:hypothetical protein